MKNPHPYNQKIAKPKSNNFCNVHQKRKKISLPFALFSSVDVIQFLQYWTGSAVFNKKKKKSKQNNIVT